MFTWKRFFVAAAVGANVLVFIMPGLGIIFIGTGGAAALFGANLTIDAAIAILVGLPLVACGVGNLLCLRAGRKVRGEWRVLSIEMGFSLCVIEAMIGFVFAVGVIHPLPLAMLGGVALVTTIALFYVRPKSIPDWQCPHCDYDLRGLPGTVCPECGMDKAERDAIAAE